MAPAPVLSVKLATATRPDVPRAARRAQSSGRGLAARERGWLVPLGRVGYAAKGLVYLLIGVLAVQAAIGTGGETTDSGGVLGHIIQAPFGGFALLAVAIGLVGYAIWRTLEGALDTQHLGSDPKALAQRIGAVVAGIAHMGLALSALAMAAGRGGQPNGDQSTQDRTAWLMSQPLGQLLVIVAGLIVIGVGCAQLYIAWKGGCEQELETGRLSYRERQFADVACRLGSIARGVAFGIVGVFLVVAGAQARPDQARGLGGALSSLADEPYGPWLLGFVAIGLIGYGAYMLLAARYRRMVLA